MDAFRRLKPYVEAQHLYKKLMSCPQYDFDQLKPSMLPEDEAGVYVIFLKNTGETLYVGRTKKLRRRLYTNHLMGPMTNARLKKYLVEDERYPDVEDLKAAKKFLKEYWRLSLSCGTRHRKAWASGRSVCLSDERALYRRGALSPSTVGGGME